MLLSFDQVHNGSSRPHHESSRGAKGSRLEDFQRQIRFRRRHLRLHNSPYVRKQTKLAKLRHHNLSAFFHPFFFVFCNVFQKYVKMFAVMSRVSCPGASIIGLVLWSKEAEPRKELSKTWTTAFYNHDEVTCIWVKADGDLGFAHTLW